MKPGILFIDDGGLVLRERTGYLSNRGLGLWKWDGGPWSVTHLATGRSVILLGSKRKAERFIRDAEKEFDWTKIKQSSRQRIARQARMWVAAWGRRSD